MRYAVRPEDEKSSPVADTLVAMDDGWTDSSNKIPEALRQARVAHSPRSLQIDKVRSRHSNYWNIQ